MRFVVISKNGIWTFDMFMEALVFAKECSCPRYNPFYIVENSELTKQIIADQDYIDRR